MPAPALPFVIESWFAGRGWRPRAHQIAMLEVAAQGRHALLTASTGAGKTLAGFLPTLAELIETPADGLHTLYISPLKALATDVERNLLSPIAEMKLDIRVESRTGDTSSDRKAKQRARPPQILLTTPESLSLLLSYEESFTMFANLRHVIVDEVHAFANGKRGDLLSLSLARLQAIAPDMRRTALSATIADVDAYRAWLAPWGDIDATLHVEGEEGADPDLQIMLPEDRMPWAGHAATYAVPQVMAEIRANKTTLVFTNTRFLAEYIFQHLWEINDDNLPIGIHHGSLSLEARRKVEGAMAAGELRALVATSSLDLGIDWGDIDCVIQMGAPKGSSRLLQRIGRANHRLDEASRAILVPGNRFEYLEAQAAFDAVAEGVRDNENFRPGGLDVLAQHVMACACAAPFGEAQLLAEIQSAMPYSAITSEQFRRTVDFVATGGYALRAYDKYRRLTEVDASSLSLSPLGEGLGVGSTPIEQDTPKDPTPLRLGSDLPSLAAPPLKERGSKVWRLSHPRFAPLHRLNAGIIVDAPMLEVRFRNGRKLGKVEEFFASSLSPGDTFFFAGQALEVEAIKDLDLIVRASKKATDIPSYGGQRLPLTTHLAGRVREFLVDRAGWGRFPDDVREWLEMQDYRSRLPEPDQLLVETFPHGPKEQRRHYMVIYPFEGWNAHQSLGMLLTRRMESAGLMPLGFVANDYSLAVWSVEPIRDPAALLSPDILTDEFIDWVEQSHLLKRAFREVAVISGLVERQHPGKRKTGKQVTFSTDLIYDVLRKYEPDHLLLEAAWADARARMTDVGRLGDLLDRAADTMLHVELERVSPLAVPVLVMIGRESVAQGATDDVLIAEAETLAGMAMRAD